MEKRGRPRKNGLQPISVLNRVTLVTYAYDQARGAGEKHMAAITEAVEFIRKNHPSMKVSETEVKRILANYRSKRRPVGLLVTKPDPADCMLTLPNGRVVRVLYSAAIGPRPIYPRANAAAKPGKDPKPRPPASR
jgi:hypothetical protein